MVDNAEKGLERACKETGAQVLEYTAAPVFMDANAKCRHSADRIQCDAGFAGEVCPGAGYRVAGNKFRL